MPNSSANGRHPFIKNINIIKKLYQHYDLYHQNNVPHYRVPEGLEDVSKFPDLVAELIDREWGESDIKKLIGENLLRVFEAVEKVGGL